MEAVCRLPGLQPVGVLLDTEVVTFRRRQKNLFRNIRIHGWTYPIFRIIEAISSVASSAVSNAAVSHAEVSQVLKKAFPDTCFSLEEQEVLHADSRGRKLERPQRRSGSW